MKPSVIEGDELRIVRVFDVPREVVFRAWSDADAIFAWSGCAGATTLAVTLDFRVGGGYRHDLRLENGLELTMLGEYLELRAPERIVYSLEWPGLPIPRTTVQVDFRDLDGKTEITLVHRGLEGEDMLREVPRGWTAGLDRLAGELASR